MEDELVILKSARDCHTCSGHCSKKQSDNKQTLNKKTNKFNSHVLSIVVVADMALMALETFR